MLAIDRENISKRIEKRLNNEELKKFRFQQQNFETIHLERNNLVIANYSIPFCNINNFKEFWQKIIDSIIPNRILCGKLFWRK